MNIYEYRLDFLSRISYSRSLSIFPAQQEKIEISNFFLPSLELPNDIDQNKAQKK